MAGRGGRVLRAVWVWLTDVHSAGPAGVWSSGFGVAAFVGSLVAALMMLLLPDSVLILGVLIVVLIVVQLIDIVVMNLPTRRAPAIGDRSSPGEADGDG